MRNCEEKEDRKPLLPVDLDGAANRAADRVTRRIAENWDNVEAASVFHDKTLELAKNPHKLLGRQNTKHGEYAEHRYVNAKNADAAASGRRPVATMDNIGRTSKVDLVCDGAALQVKCCKSTSATMRAAAKFSEANPGAVKRVLIPDDQFRQVDRIMSGKVKGIDPRTSQAVQRAIKKIEGSTGKPWKESLDSLGFTRKEASLRHAKTQHRAEQTQLVEGALARDAIIEGRSALFEGVEAAKSGAMMAASFEVGRLVVSKALSEKEFCVDDAVEITGAALKEGAKGAVMATTVQQVCKRTGMRAIPAAGAIQVFLGGIESARKYARGEIDGVDCAAEIVEKTAEASVISGAAWAMGAAAAAFTPVGWVAGAAAIAGALGGSLFCNLFRD